ncbi:MAG: hypothetical protein LC746_00715 [Acidobacteria bacterium]|nr:hypothetical protein [Acidobacteriota bacterium]
MIDSDEIQLKVQRAVQEYEDAVENLDPRFAELGRAAVAALDEFLAYWDERPEAHEEHAGGGGDAIGGESDMAEYVARQLEWGRHERERILAQLSRGGGKS